ncbi:centriole and centriolar satellite protein ofd1 isoform X1 [Amia ocellicauda]|uniref:centriole and centriolar satellite protein ofd1 isoform X1 n=1 Tax=Amia ocellicauda TaxID=2972642 RepID=UPI003464009D
MAAAKEEMISPDEMRKRLYQTFKTRGVLDTLKTQLRNQLIHELKHPVLSAEVAPRLVQAEADSVFVRASNSLVADHLRRAGYEYTLSVFYPECGLEKEKFFSTRDLLQLMKISPRSALYKSITSSMQTEQTKGFMMTLLIQLTDDYLNKQSCDAETQTAATLQCRESLADKMQMIDDQFAALHQQGNRFESLEGKFTEYRKEIEAQVQADMEQRLRHFKDIEVAKLKMEEREKSEREISALRREIERTYQSKSEALISREKNAIERLQRQHEIEEKDSYAQRQALLKEIEIVRSREAELNQRIEAFEMNCKLHGEKNRVSEEALRRRELAVKTIEDTYEQRLKNELLRYQLELKEEYLKRTEKVTEDEKTNKAEGIRLRKELAAINSMTEEHRRASAEMKRLQVELDTALSQISLLTQQNKLLRERLEETADYPALKREWLELQAQLRLMKKNLEEAQDDNRHLKTELSQPSTEYLTLQAELRRVENCRKLDEEEFESHKQLLERQLQNEVERSAHLKTQLLECEERTRWLTIHAEDVKMQLRQTQLALENEVFRNPKPSLVDRSVLDLSTDKIVPPDIYVDGPFLRSAHNGFLFDPEGPPRRGRARSGSPDSDAELVAEAKAGIRELEKEAELLEEAYRNYRHRAALMGSKPAKPQSPQQQPFGLCNRIPSISHHRVTFAEETPPLQDLDSFPLNGAALAELQNPYEESSPRQRRLSSTPLSKSERRIMKRSTEDELHSHDASDYHLSERQLSPIPPRELPSSFALASELSPPGSPPLRSTAREGSSSQKQHKDLSSSGSSPPPEIISLQDLTEPSRDHSDVAQRLEGPAPHPSARDVNGRSVAVPEPADGTSERGHGHDDPTTPEDDGPRDEEEERRWQLERKGRTERRLQERREAMAREQSELERLEQERLSDEAQQQHERVEEEVDMEPKTEAEKSASIADPLEKYMKIVLQNQGQSQQGQSPAEAAREQESSEAEIRSDERDDSIAAFSHEDADEDFW